MKTDEKLKISSSEAEILLYEQLPDDSEIDWEPSEDFLKKMEAVLQEADKPKIKISFFSKFTAVAAVLIIACIAVFLPVNRYFNDVNGGYNYGLEGDSGGIGNTNKGNDKNSNGPEDQLGASCDDVYDCSEDDVLLPFYPEYIPEGYRLVNVTVASDNITSSLEYSNGKDSFHFNSSTEEIDLSEYENSYVLDFSSNSYYCNMVPITDGDRLEGPINNVVWFYGNNTFTLVGNDNLSAEEIQKIAISFNLEPHV